MKRFAVVIEKGESGVGAYKPDLPGCAAAADSIEEVERLIRESLEFHIEGLRLRGEPIPEPTSTVEWVNVA